MDTLSEFLALKRIVEDLKEEIDLRQQIKTLKEEKEQLQKKLVTARKAASKHQRANHALRKKYGLKTETRTDRARQLIAKRESGELTISLKEIADTCFLGYSTVKSLARDMRK